MAYPRGGFGKVLSNELIGIGEYQMFSEFQIILRVALVTSEDRGPLLTTPLVQRNVNEKSIYTVTQKS